MPMHTHSKTKVYASVENGKLKSISVMNPKTGKKVMEFHLSHKHNGHIPHIHHGNGKDRTEGMAPSKSQLKFIEKLTQKAKK